MKKFELNVVNFDNEDILTTSTEASIIVDDNTYCEESPLYLITGEYNDNGTQYNFGDDYYPSMKFTFSNGVYTLADANSKDVKPVWGQTLTPGQRGHLTTGGYGVVFEECSDAHKVVEGE